MRHSSLNCKVKKTPDGKSNAPKGSGKNFQEGGSSGKGSKRSGKGRRGKMFAVLDDGNLHGGIRMPPAVMKQLLMHHRMVQMMRLLLCLAPESFGSGRWHAMFV